jgi:hypothetical protein
VLFLLQNNSNNGGDDVVARGPNRDKACEIWQQTNGEIKLKEIADQLGSVRGNGTRLEEQGQMVIIDR